MRRRKETNEVNNEQENSTARKRKINVKEGKRKIEFKKLDLNKINMDKKQILKVGVICLIVLLIILFANYTKVGIVFNKKITDKNTIQVDLTTNKNSIYPYKNEVLIYSPGKLATYNKHGKQTWSTTIEGIVGAKVSTAGKYIQVINEDKALAYIYKDKYEFSFDTIKDIGMFIEIELINKSDDFEKDFCGLLSVIEELEIDLNMVEPRKYVDYLGGL